MRAPRNPESGWQGKRVPDLPALTRARLGPGPHEPTLLSGGLRNVNIRLGSRVLRIHASDPSAAALEATLLGRRWASLRVPAVLDAGDDFLLLEYVPHADLTPGPEDGADVGRALAEIHSRGFSRFGFLDSSLEVAEEMGDPIETLLEHAEACVPRVARRLDRGLAARAAAFLRSRRQDMSRAAGRPVLLHGDFKVSNLHRAGSGDLLVLDWEFAWAGPALMDVGQLFRWSMPAAFTSAFAEEYRAGGGLLPRGWSKWAPIFDLCNLLDLLARSMPGSRRARDVTRRIRQTIGGS